jgi:hypothetical protein
MQQPTTAGIIVTITVARFQYLAKRSRPCAGSFFVAEFAADGICGRGAFSSVDADRIY